MHHVVGQGRDQLPLPALFFVVCLLPLRSLPWCVKDDMTGDVLLQGGGRGGERKGIPLKSDHQQLHSDFCLCPLTLKEKG